MLLSNQTQKGISLVEVVVVASIISVFFVSVSGVYNLYIRTAERGLHTTKAAFLAEEGIEVMKFLRDTSWSQSIDPLSIGTLYYLSWDGSTWMTTTIPQYIDGYERTVTLSTVRRDGSSDIVSSGGTLDDNARKITVSVSWPDRGATTTKSMETYLTNLLEN